MRKLLDHAMLVFPGSENKRKAVIGDDVTPVQGSMLPPFPQPGYSYTDYNIFTHYYDDGFYDEFLYDDFYLEFEDIVVPGICHEVSNSTLLADFGFGGEAVFPGVAFDNIAVTYDVGRGMEITQSVFDLDLALCSFFLSKAILLPATLCEPASVFSQSFVASGPQSYEIHDSFEMVTTSNDESNFYFSFSGSVRQDNCLILDGVGHTYPLWMVNVPIPLYKKFDFTGRTIEPIMYKFNGDYGDGETQYRWRRPYGFRPYRNNAWEVEADNASFEPGSSFVVHDIWIMETEFSLNPYEIPREDLWYSPQHQVPVYKLYQYNDGVMYRGIYIGAETAGDYAIDTEYAILSGDQPKEWEALIFNDNVQSTVGFGSAALTYRYEEISVENALLDTMMREPDIEVIEHDLGFDTSPYRGPSLLNSVGHEVEPMLWYQISNDVFDPTGASRSGFLCEIFVSGDYESAGHDSYVGHEVEPMLWYRFENPDYTAMGPIIQISRYDEEIIFGQMETPELTHSMFEYEHLAVVPGDPALGFYTGTISDIAHTADAGFQPALTHALHEVLSVFVEYSLADSQDVPGALASVIDVTQRGSMVTYDHVHLLEVDMTPAIYGEGAMFVFDAILLESLDCAEGLPGIRQDWNQYSVYEIADATNFVLLEDSMFIEYAGVIIDHMEATAEMTSLRPDWDFNSAYQITDGADKLWGEFVIDGDREAHSTIILEYMEHTEELTAIRQGWNLYSGHIVIDQIWAEFDIVGDHFEHPGMTTVVEDAAFLNKSGVLITLPPSRPNLDFFVANRPFQSVMYKKWSMYRGHGIMYRGTQSEFDIFRYVTAWEMDDRTWVDLIPGMETPISWEAFPVEVDFTQDIDLGPLYQDAMELYYNGLRSASYRNDVMYKSGVQYRGFMLPSGADAYIVDIENIWLEHDFFGDHVDHPVSLTDSVYVTAEDTVTPIPNVSHLCHEIVPHIWSELDILGNHLEHPGTDFTIEDALGVDVVPLWDFHVSHEVSHHIFYAQTSPDPVFGYTHDIQIHDVDYADGGPFVAKLLFEAEEYLGIAGKLDTESLGNIPGHEVDIPIIFEFGHPGTPFQVREIEAFILADWGWPDVPAPWPATIYEIYEIDNYGSTELLDTAYNISLEFIDELGEHMPAEFTAVFMEIDSTQERTSAAFVYSAYEVEHIFAQDVSAAHFDRGFATEFGSVEFSMEALPPSYFDDAHEVSASFADFDWMMSIDHAGFILENLDSVVHTELPAVTGMASEVTELAAAFVGPVLSMYQDWVVLDYLDNSQEEKFTDVAAQVNEEIQGISARLYVSENTHCYRSWAVLDGVDHIPGNRGAAQFNVRAAHEVEVLAPLVADCARFQYSSPFTPARALIELEFDYQPTEPYEITFLF